MMQEVRDKSSRENNILLERPGKDPGFNLTAS